MNSDGEMQAFEVYIRVCTNRLLVVGARVKYGGDPYLLAAYIFFSLIYLLSM